MISLQDSTWRTLRHAYGSAAEIPALLLQVSMDPASADVKDDPWFGIWSALCHQGDVYPASFAAVPHVVQILSENPADASHEFFLFPASVEVARWRKDVIIPEDLYGSYRTALDRFPKLAAQVAERDWMYPFGRSVLAAVAVSKGLHSEAEILLEVDHNDDPEVIEWYLSR